MICLKRKKNFIAELLLVIVVVPLFVAVGSFVFCDRRYMLISTAVAIASCFVFYLSFEKNERGSHRLVILAVMTALSVVGRFVFAPVPFFKPVAAIVIICGMNMGCEAGFLCGSLSAFLSNFLFMQGPWTPFQMFIWGMIGFAAGLIREPLKKSRALLFAYGALSGIVYSAFMDIWTTVWFDGHFLFSRYIAAIAAALPITAVYVISNIVFLMLLSAPVSRKLERVNKKYGLDLEK